jgi:sigma-B regulation protein RsbU (phosphoserine phosphatase)
MRACAGSDLPIIFDPTTEQFLDLEGGGLPLGVMAEETYEEYELGNLSPGTIIAFMTDGIFEARNKAEQMYGKERIMQIIRDNHELSAEKIASILEDDVDQFQEGTSQEDDITHVIVKLEQLSLFLAPSA